jgi:hypothetical protein
MAHQLKPAMTTNRKYRLSQKFVVKEIGDQHVLMYVVEDLTDEEIRLQFAHFLDKEDYEYCDALKAEARARNIKLKSYR